MTRAVVGKAVIVSAGTPIGVPVFTAGWIASDAAGPAMNAPMSVCDPLTLIPIAVGILIVVVRAPTPPPAAEAA